MLKKRITSMLLALTMVVSLGSQTFAAEIEAARVEAQVMDEIETEQAEVFAEVYAQLEAQGRLDHYEKYVEILTPKIEATIREEHGLAVPYSELGLRAISRPENAPNGGTLFYTQTGLTSVVERYYDVDDTKEYVIDPSDARVSFWRTMQAWVTVPIDVYIADRLKDAVLTAGQKSTILLSYRVLLEAIIKMESVPKKEIDACGGYAYKIRLHEPTEDTVSNIVLAWKHHPTVYVPTTNVHNASWDPKV